MTDYINDAKKRADDSGYFVTDCIKREDATNVFCWNEDLYVRCGIATQNIKDIPSADVVEVVRCKDCEHGQSYNMFGSRYCLKHNDVAVRDNDFCSYGERAEA